MRTRRALGSIAGLALFVAAGAAVAGRAATTGASMRTIAVGEDPGALAIDDRTRRVFVSNEGDGSVSVLDQSSGAMVRTVRIGGMPGAIAVDARRSLALVLSQPSNPLARSSVVALDALTGQPLGAVVVGHDASAIAVDPGSDHAFVANSSDDTISMLDLQNLSVVRVIAAGRKVATGYDPTSIVVDARRHRALVIDEADDGVDTIDTLTGALVQSAGLVSPASESTSESHAAALDETSGRVFVTNAAHMSVSMIDARRGTVGREILLADFPGAVALDGAAGHVLVVNQAGTELSILDERSGSLVRTVPVAPYPEWQSSEAASIAVDSKRHRAFVVTSGDPAPVADRWSWLPPWLRRTLPWGGQSAPPGAVAAPGTLTILDTRTGAVLRATSVGANSASVAVDELTGRAYVLSTGLTSGDGGTLTDGTLTVVDPSR